MNFYKKYYLELKNRIILLSFTWITGIFICYLHKDVLLFLLIESSQYLIETQEKPYFIFTEVSEIFHVYLQLIFFITNQTVLLMIFYHVLVFFAAGLYKFEFTRLYAAFRVFILAWGCSILLLYNLVMPYTWKFFLSFQETRIDYTNVDFFFEAKILEYLQYFIDLYYLCLLNCQLLAVILLVLTNLTKTSQSIKSFRKLFYFVFVIFSTLTTPPDIISQAFLSFVLILSYEGLIVSKCVKTSMVTN